jgi:hypothetical protein
MRFVLTALIFLFGLFDLWVGASFLLTPETAGAGFGLAADGAQGLAVLRADFTAFFWVSALCMMQGAWRRNGDLLLVPAALFGIALGGRVVSAALDGVAPGYWVPMVIEALHVGLLVSAWRILPHHPVEEIAG